MNLSTLWALMRSVQSDTSENGYASLDGAMPMFSVS